MKKILSLIISINLIIPAAPAYPGGRDFLAVPGYAEQERQIEEFLEKHGEDNPIIFEKDGVTHIIFGVNHKFKYPDAYIDDFILKDDIVTSEGFIQKKFLLFNAIFKSIIKLFMIFFRSQANQNEHQNKLIQDNVKLLNLDIVYKKSGSLAILAVLSMFLNISFLIYQVIIGFNLLYFEVWMVCFMLFSSSNFLLNPGIYIDIDFRDLNFAEKLAYLKNIIKKKNVRVITIIGKGHKEDTVRLLLSDSLRKKKWEAYTEKFFLRRALKRKTDIVESMEIRKLLPGKDFDVIGTIADLPGPRNLIAAIEKSH